MKFSPSRIMSYFSGKYAIINALLILVLSANFVYAQANPDADPDPETCPTNKNKGGSLTWAYSIGKVSYKKKDVLQMARAVATKGFQLNANPSTFDESLSKSYYQDPSKNLNWLNLTIETVEINEAALSPASLRISRNNSVQVIEISGVIKQITTHDTFVNILPKPVGFHVKVYDKIAKGAIGGDGLFTVSSGAVPIQEMIVRTPDGGAFTNAVETVVIDRKNSGGIKVDVIRHTRDKVADTQKTFVFAGSLDSSGNPVIGELLETDDITFSNRGASPQSYTLIRETKRITTTPSGIQPGSLKLVSRRLEQYDDYTAGAIRVIDGSKPEISPPVIDKRLIREIDGYGTTEAKETRCTFYRSSDNPMTNGRLRSKVYPDGKWEYYSYVDAEGAAFHEQTKLSAWRDVPFNDSTGPTSATLANCKIETTAIYQGYYEKTVKYGGILISKEKFESYLEADGTRLCTLSQQDSGGNLLSKRIWKLNSENAADHLAGRIEWMENPDGTAETYEYIASPDGGFQVIQRKGAGTRLGVTSGTEITSEYNKFAELYGKTVHDISAGLNLNFWVATSVDSIGRPIRIEYNGNSDDYETFQYACCGLERKRQRDGSVTTWTRDPLKRVYLQSANRYDGDPSPLTTSYTFDGLVTSSSRGGILVKEETKLLSGDMVLIKTPDQNGDGIPEVTIQSTSYASGSGKVVSLTYPDGGTEIQSFFLDGAPKSISGTAVADQSYNYGTHSLGLWKQTVRLDSSGNTNEWEKSYFNGLNRLIKVETPSTSTSKSWQYYSADSATAGSKTKLSKFTDEDGVQKYYTYDAEGKRSSNAEDIVDSKVLYKLFSHQTVNDPELGVGEKASTTLRSGPTGSGVVIEEKFTSGDGFSTKSTSLGQTTTSVTTPATTAGNYSVTTTHPDGTRTVETYQGNLLTKTETQDSSATNVKWTSYSYDSLRRVTSVTDSRTGTTTINSYTDGGKVASETDSAGWVTTYSYDAMGRRTTLDAPNTQDSAGNPFSNITSTSWYPTGLEKATWGDLVYATFKSYDEQGRLNSLSTYRNLAHGVEPTSATAGADKTLWNYNSKGQLASKRYADNTGPSYLYTPAGKLFTSTSGRAIVTTYTYDKGYLISKDYSDLTPDVTTSYDGYGRVSMIAQFKQSNISYTYDATTLALKTETVTYDLDHEGTGDFTRIIDRSRDSILRDTGWQLKDGTTIENEVEYGYDASGRFSTLTKGASNFSYQYLANSDLISQINKPDGRRAINTWETTRDILSYVRNVQVAGTTLQHSRYNYFSDELGRRTFGTEQATVHSSTTLSRQWDYNARGELILAGGSQSGSIRSYEYDSIGNRKKSADGPTLPTTDNYVSNNVNQYEEAQGQSPIYDGDGNANEYPLPATSSMAALEWDAENRLVSLTDNSNSVEYQYDALSRRIAKKVNGSITLYVYDGWNCIADYSYGSPVASLTRSYVWGLDLSGTLQGAGGVGGLLRMTIHSASPTDYYSSYDGNGNLCEYRSSASVTHFDYDTFGRVVASSGNPELFDIRFSTKRQDVETDLYYYGFRYYDSINGRWLGRDSIEERGGLNLYAFLRNDGVNKFDLLGNEECRHPDIKDPEKTAKCNETGNLKWAKADAVHQAASLACLRAGHPVAIAACMFVARFNYLKDLNEVKDEWEKCLDEVPCICPASGVNVTPGRQ